MDKILLVEDDEDIAKVVIYNLERDGFQVAWKKNSADALTAVRTDEFSALVLDVMLPGIDGFDLLRLIRLEGVAVPTIFVSAKTQETDILKGLELGADDYLIKPFSPKILIAKVKHLIARKNGENSEPESEGEVNQSGTQRGNLSLALSATTENADRRTSIIEMSEIRIDPDRHEVRVMDKLIELTSTEFKILHTLMKKPGWVFSRYKIVDEVHGEYYSVTDRSVDVQIAGLRKKLGTRGKVIETVRGVGYKFADTTTSVKLVSFGN